MKKVSKGIVFAVLTVTLCLLCALTACNGTKEIKSDHSDVKILFLGDSIAEGVLGPAPVIEREDYAYASVVGQINGFTYRNRSVSGHMTWQMLDYVSAEKDESAYALITNIKTADIISVSILGNDLLQTSFSKYANPAIVGDFEDLDELLEESYENIVGIVHRLKELNPTAPLIFQTVYNPAYKDTELIGNDIRSEMYKNGLTDDDVYAVAGLLITRLNNVLRRYAAAYPGDILILDVNDKFDQMYRAGGNEQLDRLIFGDDIHPSNEGHAVIAGLLQEMLETLGYADHDEVLANYKILCENRLKRLYTGTSVNVKAVTKAIEKATTYSAVTKVYFDATNEVVPKYEKSTNADVDEQTGDYDKYTIESVEMIGRDFSVFFDSEKSYVLLEKSGKNRFEIALGLTDTVMTFAQGFASSGLDAETVSWGEKYVHAMLPTESLTDAESTLERLKTDLGIEVHGLDPEDENTKKVIESLAKEEGVPEGTQIPDNVYFSVSGTYEKTLIASLTQEDPFEAAYLGEHRKNGESYLLLTYFEDENGKKSILIHNDVLSLNVRAYLTTDEAE